MRPNIPCTYKEISVYFCWVYCYNETVRSFVEACGCHETSLATMPTYSKPRAFVIETVCDETNRHCQTGLVFS